MFSSAQTIHKGWDTLPPLILPEKLIVPIKPVIEPIQETSEEFVVFDCSIC